jgi:two-component system competent response regulator ComA
LLEEECGWRVIVVTSTPEARSSLRQSTFDALLFELDFPGMNGIELARWVVAQKMELPMLVYTGQEILPYFDVLVEARVSGFLHKNDPDEQMIAAIRYALNGKAVLSADLLWELRRKVADQKDSSFNVQERQILEALAQGKSNEESARFLLMSQRTLERHLTCLYRKLEIKSRGTAVREARRRGIIVDECGQP